MDDVTIYVHPQCSKSSAATQLATEMGVVADLVDYTDQPLDAGALYCLIAKLEHAVTDLVRRDDLFAALGLTDDDVATTDQVVEVLLDQPLLMQRPVIERGDRAAVARTPDRARELLDRPPPRDLS